MLIFGARRLLSLKNCQICLPKIVFQGFFRKYCFFKKKFLNKKYSAYNLWLKKVIFIIGVRWPLAGRTVTQWPCCKQSKGFTSTFWNIALLAHFLRQRFFNFGAEHWKNYWLYRNMLQMKVKQNLISYKNLSRSISLSFPGVELEGAKHLPCTGMKK